MGFTEADGTLGEVFDVIASSDMVILLISDAAQVRRPARCALLRCPAHAAQRSAALRARLGRSAGGSLVAVGGGGAAPCWPGLCGAVLVTAWLSCLPHRPASCGRCKGSGQCDRLPPDGRSEKESAA